MVISALDDGYHTVGIFWGSDCKEKGSLYVVSEDIHKEIRDKCKGKEKEDRMKQFENI